MAFLQVYVHHMLVCFNCRWRGYMDGAVESGERAGYEVALRVYEASAAAVSSGDGSISSPRVVPPEAPGEEPENKKVSWSLMRISMYSADAIVCLQIPHPVIVTPSPVERMSPSVPTAVAIVTIGLAALSMLAFNIFKPRLWLSR